MFCIITNQTTAIFFFIEIENFRGEGKILMRHTHDPTFSEIFFDFNQILEESEPNVEFWKKKFARFARQKK
jgi:hypothetical protein